ncbi:hypothetical protein [Roseisolibacter sp. H3M3-2]|uniref:hypothetical protein n=1 Tax=Roseisolibacter sp. H3M3-2 TaxID=3031323 RepID=UPI0023DA809D|nr:hypothetical protein [Roseisolibacter sp. H3M3-2]MDF1503978.1 hypothetical protein [Roseisolibacter sp. H3M3-2]
MTPDVRRGLAALLAGTAASLAALLVATLVRSRACANAGGEWMEGVRRCAMPAGAPEPSTWGSSLAGAAVGIVTLVVLWRTFTFFAARRDAR